MKGKVYRQKDPALRIRVVGQAPIEATVYELERLRCNLCGDLFEAEAPEGVGEKKYDETAAAMIARVRILTLPWLIPFMFPTLSLWLARETPDLMKPEPFLKTAGSGLRPVLRRACGVRFRDEFALISVCGV